MRFELDADQKDFAAALDSLLANADTVAVARAWAGGDHEPGRKLWGRLAEMGVTSAPFCEISLTNPSASSWRSASRTGLRLTPNSCAICSCSIFMPPRYWPATMRRRSSSTTWVAMVSRLMARRFTACLRPSPADGCGSTSPGGRRR